MSSECLAAVLQQVFPDGVPPKLDALIDLEFAGDHLVDFKLNPVLPIGRETPHRIAYADKGEAEAWAARVLAAFPEDGLEAFLSSVPSGCRRMIDSDGEMALVYLDDLHQVKHAYEGPPGQELMCATLAVPGAIHAVVTHHDNPPLALVSGDPGLEAFVSRITGAGGAGMWGLRWAAEETRPCSVLWITESRYRADVPGTLKIVDELFGLPDAWERIAKTANTGGLQPYVDALEGYADGSCDLTVGWLVHGAT